MSDLTEIKNNEPNLPTQQDKTTFTNDVNLIAMFSELAFYSKDSKLEGAQYNSDLAIQLAYKERLEGQNPTNTQFIEPGRYAIKDLKSNDNVGFAATVLKDTFENKVYIMFRSTESEVGLKIPFVGTLSTDNFLNNAFTLAGKKGPQLNSAINFTNSIMNNSSIVDANTEIIFGGQSSGAKLAAALGMMTGNDAFTIGSPGFSDKEIKALGGNINGLSNYTNINNICYANDPVCATNKYHPGSMLYLDAGSVKGTQIHSNGPNWLFDPDNAMGISEYQEFLDNISGKLPATLEETLSRLDSESDKVNSIALSTKSRVNKFQFFIKPLSNLYCLGTADTIIFLKNLINGNNTPPLENNNIGGYSDDIDSIFNDYFKDSILSSGNDIGDLSDIIDDVMIDVYDFIGSPSIEKFNDLKIELDTDLNNGFIDLNKYINSIPYDAQSEIFAMKDQLNITINNLANINESNLNDSIGILNNFADFFDIHLSNCLVSEGQYVVDYLNYANYINAPIINVIKKLGNLAGQLDDVESIASGNMANWDFSNPSKITVRVNSDSEIKTQVETWKGLFPNSIGLEFEIQSNTSLVSINADKSTNIITDSNNIQNVATLFDSFVGSKIPYGNVSIQTPDYEYNMAIGAQDNVDFTTTDTDTQRIDALTGALILETIRNVDNVINYVNDNTVNYFDTYESSSNSGAINIPFGLIGPILPEVENIVDLFTPIGAFYEGGTLTYDDSVSIADKTGRLLYNGSPVEKDYLVNTLDSNQNHKIEENDTGFYSLEIWQDTNNKRLKQCA